MAGNNALTDLELLNRFRSGDDKAFGVIYEKFYAALCFFALRLTNDRAAAEDIVQEILCKLWQKHQDFEDLGAIKAFLYISTRNACMNHLVAVQRKEKHHLELEKMPLQQTEVNEVIYAEALREITAALGSLPDQCAKVMRMLYQEGLRPQEIADSLGITVSTVYNQRMRGVAILRSRLSKHGFEVLAAILLTDHLMR